MKIRVVLLVLIALGVIIAPAQAKKGKVKALPPGLQKNLDRGKSLPSGWHKKLSKGKIIEPDIYGRGRILVPLDPLGIVTIKIEDKIFRVMDKSREIVDILHE